MEFTKNHIHQVIAVRLFCAKHETALCLSELNVWGACLQHALSTARENSKSSASSFEAIYNKVIIQIELFIVSSTA